MGMFRGQPVARGPSSGWGSHSPEGAWVKPKGDGRHSNAAGRGIPRGGGGGEGGRHAGRAHDRPGKAFDLGQARFVALMGVGATREGPHEQCFGAGPELSLAQRVRLRPRQVRLALAMWRANLVTARTPWWLASTHVAVAPTGASGSWVA